MDSLQSIFKDGDAGVSGYVPTDGESTPAPTPTPIPEKEEESVPAPDNSEPFTTPIPELTPTPLRTAYTDVTQPSKLVVPPIESKELDLYCGKGRKNLKRSLG